MDAADHQPKFWSSTQTYSMAAICLILGVVVGYLVHAPAVASSNTPTAVVAPPPSTPASMPSEEDLKRMADKHPTLRAA